MTKRAFIIHGWGGWPEEGWFPWLKTELEKNGFVVSVPEMPNSNEPKLTEWLAYLEAQVGTPDEHTFLVGHSLGCITILRYLESLVAGQKIGGAVFVAGFFEKLTFPQIDNFLEVEPDFEKIRVALPKAVVIHGRLDGLVPLSFGQRLSERLGSPFVEISDGQHFSGREYYIDLPEALEAVLQMTRRR